jgi:hypothetical protein
MAIVGLSYFFHDAETAVSHSPLLGLLSQQPKNCIGLPEADPSCFVTCMSLRLATAWDLVKTKAANNIWSLGVHWQKSHTAGWQQFDMR